MCHLIFQLLIYVIFQDVKVSHADQWSSGEEQQGNEDWNWTNETRLRDPKISMQYAKLQKRNWIHFLLRRGIARKFHVLRVADCPKCRQ